MKCMGLEHVSSELKKKKCEEDFKGEVSRSESGISMMNQHLAQHMD